MPKETVILRGGGLRDGKVIDSLCICLPICFDFFYIYAIKYGEKSDLFWEEILAMGKMLWGLCVPVDS